VTGRSRKKMLIVTPVYYNYRMKKFTKIPPSLNVDIYLHPDNEKREFHIDEVKYLREGIIKYTTENKTIIRFVTVSTFAIWVWIYKYMTEESDFIYVAYMIPFLLCYTGGRLSLFILKEIEYISDFLRQLEVKVGIGRWESFYKHTSENNMKNLGKIPKWFYGVWIYCVGLSGFKTSSKKYGIAAFRTIIYYYTVILLVNILILGGDIGCNQREIRLLKNIEDKCGSDFATNDPRYISCTNAEKYKKEKSSEEE